MPYERKTKDEWVVQTYTGRQYGWEDSTTESTREEGKKRLKEYRENQKEYTHRLRKRRVKIEQPS